MQPELHINVAATLLMLGVWFSLLGVVFYRFRPPLWLIRAINLPQTQRGIFWRVTAPGIACLVVGIVWGLLALGGVVSPTVPN